MLWINIGIRFVRDFGILILVSDETVGEFIDYVFYAAGILLYKGG